VLDLGVSSDVSSPFIPTDSKQRRRMAINQTQDQGLDEEIADLEERLKNARARRALATGKAPFLGKQINK
jgi:hypothetical protein